MTARVDSSASLVSPESRAMVKTHKYTGTWWLPGDDAKQIYGTLTVTRGHAELELLSNFGNKLISETEKEKVFSLWLEEPRRIVGIGASRDEITLEGRGLANPGDMSSYQPPWVLVGKAF